MLDRFSKVINDVVHFISGGLLGSRVIKFLGLFLFLVFGVTLSPFISLAGFIGLGLATDYGTNTNARYTATKSEIMTADINPNIAFKVNDKFSLGAGFNAQYMDATLNQNLGVPSVLTPFAVNGDADSNVINEADDWGYGWNAGMLYQFTPGSRVGLSYRSKIDYTLEGDSKIKGGSYQNQKSNNLKADVTLPPITTLSIFNEVNQQWALMGSIYYTQWSKIKNLTLNNAIIPDSTAGFNPITGTIATTSGTTILPQNFDNTWRVALGGQFKLNEKWMFRAGAYHDQTPTNDTDRSIRLGEEDRLAIAIGATYHANQYFEAVAGYTHTWAYDDAKTSNVSAGVIDGKVNGNANIFGLQANINIV
jgi:long-chain fatty acid transport protein